MSDALWGIVDIIGFGLVLVGVASLPNLFALRPVRKLVKVIGWLVLGGIVIFAIAYLIFYPPRPSPRGVMVPVYFLGLVFWGEGGEAGSGDGGAA